jgi:hypothetical protein
MVYVLWETPTKETSNSARDILMPIRRARAAGGVV